MSFELNIGAFLFMNQMYILSETKIRIYYTCLKRGRTYRPLSKLPCPQLPINKFNTLRGHLGSCSIDFSWLFKGFNGVPPSLRG